MSRPTIYIHHDAYNTAGPHLGAVDEQHKNEGYPISEKGHYTFYQWFIEKNGVVIHTRPDMDPLVIHKDVHKNSISVCLAGNFNKYHIGDEQRGAIGVLFNQLKTQYGTTALDIKEHRDYQDTSCPGRGISKNYFAYLFAETQYGVVQAALYRILLKMLSRLK